MKKTKECKRKTEEAREKITTVDLNSTIIDGTMYHLSITNATNT